VAVAWDLVNAFVFCAAESSSPTAVERLNTLLRSDLFPEAAKRGYTSLFLLCVPATLSEPIRRELETHDARPRTLNFHSRSAGNAGGGEGGFDRLGEELDVKRLTAGMLASDLGNIDEICSCIDACWPTRERFLEEGIGYALIQEGEVASWCGTDYVVDSAADLYVETFGDHQGKGFATAVASACIAACLAERWTVHWHCWSDNRGSVRVAEKNGLVLRSAAPTLRVQPGYRRG
jgi:GNAT superfamily N-acetyltransferase